MEANTPCHRISGLSGESTRTPNDNQSESEREWGDRRREWGAGGGGGGVSRGNRSASNGRPANWFSPYTKRVSTDRWLSYN